MTGMTQRKTFFTPTIQKKIAKLTKIKLDSGERREENGEPVPSPPLFFFSHTTTATTTRTSKKQPVYWGKQQVSHFFVHFSAVTARLWRENSLFYVKRRRIFFSFLNLSAVPKKSTPGKIAYIRYFQRNGINATNVFAAVAVFDAKSPYYLNACNRLSRTPV